MGKEMVPRGAGEKFETVVEPRVYEREWEGLGLNRNQSQIMKPLECYTKELAYTFSLLQGSDTLL